MIYKSGMLDFLRQELNDLNREGLLRKPRVISDIAGARVKIDNRWFVSFCSNDYLGLAQHPALKQAMIGATKKFGSGAGAARLLSGTTALHQELEREIARFKDADDALLFTSGYAANLGVITTLINKNDVVFCDELNHASLVDASRCALLRSASDHRLRQGAARLTKAQLHVYRHCDTAHLETLLRSALRSTPHALRFIITDSIFSMDGDGAPLKEIVHLAKKYRAYTIVDEAHGTGVFGKNGRGWCEVQGLEPCAKHWSGAFSQRLKRTGRQKVDIIIGTASKALGSLGGFVAGSQVLIDYIRNKSRPFIFTTALPPGTCAATITALKVLRQEPGLRKRLWTNTYYLKGRLTKMGFNLRNSISPIIPIMIGDTRKTVVISQALWAKGLYVPAIRPPTVPQGESRLRITITAMHTKKQMDELLNALWTQICADKRR